MIHFFDVGANVGQTFDDYLLKGGFDGATIWCFEPSPRHVSALREKCDLMMQSGHGWKINLCPFGLLDKTGWEPLFEKNDARGDSFIHELYLAGNYIPNRGMLVKVFSPVVDIVDFIFRNVVPPDTITIKIDTEGSEFKILERILEQPETWSLIDKLLVEWHGIDSVDGWNPKAEEIRNRLKTANITLEGWSY